MDEIIELLKRIEERQIKLEHKILSIKKVLTLQECADFSGISISHLYKLTATNNIPHYKPNGKMVYFDRVEIENYLLTNKVSK